MAARRPNPVSRDSAVPTDITAVCLRSAPRPLRRGRACLTRVGPPAALAGPAGQQEQRRPDRQDQRHPVVDGRADDDLRRRRWPRTTPARNPRAGCPVRTAPGQPGTGLPGGPGRRRRTNAPRGRRRRRSPAPLEAQAGGEQAQAQVDGPSVSLRMLERHAPVARGQRDGLIRSHRRHPAKPSVGDPVHPRQERPSRPLVADELLGLGQQHAARPWSDTRATPRRGTPDGTRAISSRASRIAPS